MNQPENDNSTVIEDLPVDEARQDHVKGGPTNTYTGVTTINAGTLTIR
ncbi:MAG: autotransporter-associated beta strand repeat-containing protein [Acidobacteriota bacterium]